jgi:hypothetical protein
MYWPDAGQTHLARILVKRDGLVLVNLNGQVPITRNGQIPVRLNVQILVKHMDHALAIFFENRPKNIMPDTGRNNCDWPNTGNKKIGQNMIGQNWSNYEGPNAGQITNSPTQNEKTQVERCLVEYWSKGLTPRIRA